MQHPLAHSLHHIGIVNHPEVTSSLQQDACGVCGNRTHVTRWIRASMQFGIPRRFPEPTPYRCHAGTKMQNAAFGGMAAGETKDSGIS